MFWCVWAFQIFPADLIQKHCDALTHAKQGEMQPVKKMNIIDAALSFFKMNIIFWGKHRMWHCVTPSATHFTWHLMTSDNSNDTIGQKKNNQFTLIHPDKPFRF